MRYVTLLVAGGVLFGSVQLIALLPTGFIPKGDESRLVLSVQLPPGSRLEDTEAKTEEIAAIIRKNEHVRSVFVLGGSSPTGNVAPRNASVYVNLTYKTTSLGAAMLNPVIQVVNSVLPFDIPEWPHNGRVKPQWDVEEEFMPAVERVADVRMWKIQDRGAREVQFNLLSDDPKELDAAVAKLEAALRQEPKLKSPSVEGSLDRPEIKVKPKLDEAARLGITPQQISDAVRVATIGDFGPSLAKFKAGDRLIPIRVQIPDNSTRDFNELLNLKLTTASGLVVPITAVADVTFARGPASVNRFDRLRQVVVGADLPLGVELGDATEAFKKVFAELKLPASVRFEEGGDAEVQGEIFTSFGKAAGLGLVIMLGILVLLLGNIFQPLAIVFSLPLAIGGVVLALLFRNQSLSMPVIIGMLMLMGIVAKNAIMLIDFAVERVKHGMDRVDAIVDAGRKRARPIIMTTIAMGAGMLPSAIGIGEGGEFRAPMATAVIGGLIASTILSLVFVPSFYLVMDDAARLTRWAFGRFVGPTDEPTEEDKVAKLEAEMAELQSRIDALQPKQRPQLAVAAE